MKTVRSSRNDSRYSLPVCGVVMLALADFSAAVPLSPFLPLAAALMALILFAFPPLRCPFDIRTDARHSDNKTAPEIAVGGELAPGASDRAASSKIYFVLGK